MRYVDDHIGCLWIILIVRIHLHFDFLFIFNSKIAAPPVNILASYASRNYCGVS